jgi:hypothetical protein
MLKANLSSNSAPRVELARNRGSGKLIFLPKGSVPPMMQDSSSGPSNVLMDAAIVYGANRWLRGVHDDPAWPYQGSTFRLTIADTSTSSCISYCCSLRS